jgi:two-component system, NtrC family, nitrogen regulation sensor histidine kinase GlnL
VGSLFLTASALLYVSDLSPLPPRSPFSLAAPNRILGLLATQVAAFFLVDLLGQLLARRLNEQRIFTRELIDQLGEGVLAVDRLGMVAYVNAEAIRLLELSPGSQGRALAQVLGSDSEVARRMLTEESCPSLRRVIGPRERKLVLRCTELTGRSGRPIGRTLLIADETRLQILEDSARRAEHLAALGEMAAGIAHEVRNPLASLRGCAQELAEINRKDGNRDAADLGAILVGEADRLGRIVEDFLTLSRMRQPDRTTVDLARLLGDLRELYGQRRDVGSEIRLSFSVADGTPRVFADGDQLRQVLTNLVNNAIDAVRHSAMPTISVQIRPALRDSALEGDAVEIVVTDNGCGIPLELQERIFTPFFSTKSQGTGLGLSLVQRIIREHEGVVQLNSQPGQGTTVSVLLPAHSQTRVFIRALGGE